MAKYIKHKVVEASSTVKLEKYMNELSREGWVADGIFRDAVDVNSFYTIMKKSSD